MQESGSRQRPKAAKRRHITGKREVIAKRRKIPPDQPRVIPRSQLAIYKILVFWGYSVFRVIPFWWNPRTKGFQTEDSKWTFFMSVVHLSTRVAILLYSLAYWFLFGVNIMQDTVEFFCFTLLGFGGLMSTLMHLYLLQQPTCFPALLNILYCINQTFGHCSAGLDNNGASYVREQRSFETRLLCMGICLILGFPIVMYILYYVQVRIFVLPIQSFATLFQISETLCMHLTVIAATFMWLTETIPWASLAFTILSSITLLRVCLERNPWHPEVRTVRHAMHNQLRLMYQSNNEITGGATISLVVFLAHTALIFAPFCMFRLSTSAFETQTSSGVFIFFLILQCMFLVTLRMMASWGQSLTDSSKQFIHSIKKERYKCSQVDLRRLQSYPSFVISFACAMACDNATLVDTLHNYTINAFFTLLTS